MKTSYSILGLAAAAALALVSGQAADLKAKDQVQIYMRVKMLHTQSIMEGLALERFDQVSRAAMDLRKMSLSNIWFVSKSVPFREQTTNFQHQVDALYLAATDKKLKESTEAYQNVIHSCVACHADFRLEQRLQHLNPKNKK